MISKQSVSDDVDDDEKWWLDYIIKRSFLLWDSNFGRCEIQIKLSFEFLLSWDFRVSKLANRTNELIKIWVTFELAAFLDVIKRSW